MTKIRKKIGTIPINDIEQQVQQSTQAAVEQMQQDVTDFINEETAQYPEIGGAFKFQEDPEGRSEITTDAEGKVISYRDSEGVKHENAGIETNHLGLSKEGMTEFQQALKNSGFNPGGKGDWSDYISDDGEKPLHIETPSLALINIISDYDLTRLSKEGYSSSSSYPRGIKGVTYDIPTEVEFYDGRGNYFKKWTLMSGQGSSSMSFIKKNIALDFFDDGVYDDKGKLGEGDALSVKFGNWVPQDSFHLKSFYTDFFKGVSIVSYQIAEEVAKTRGMLADRPWKKHLLSKNTITSDYYRSDELDDIMSQMDNGARCMPDGFPCVVYQNGNFYGMFTFNIKKHRDNYHMKKDIAEHVHLDGSINGDTIFNGTIDWTKFEVRNPKNLYYKESHNKKETGESTFEYDADSTGQFEIADQATVDAWIAEGSLPDGTKITSKIKKNLQRTAKVHKYIVDFSSIQSKINAKSTTEEKKQVFETYFDLDNIVDYEVLQTALHDYDAYTANWQWITYDGVKWYACNYDKDRGFGGGVCQSIIYPPITTAAWLDTTSRTPIRYVISLYNAELKARYKELVELGIFTADHFVDLMKKWMDRFGADNYEKEYAKWSQSPCNREPLFDNDNWQFLKVTWETGTNLYDNTRVYNAGETCQCQCGSWLAYFEAKQETVGNPPMTGTYSLYPEYFGYKDSLWRFSRYAEDNLSVLNDSFLH